jgi:curved DNA-binding protein CbpA
MVELQLFNEVAPSQPLLSPMQMRAYRDELDILLARIECASDPYAVLGVERTAGYDEVWYSYRHHVALLYPSYQINNTFPESTQMRIERAFARLSRAFAVLASFGRRRKYDEETAAVARKLSQSKLTDHLQAEAAAAVALRIQEDLPSLNQTAASVVVPAIQTTETVTESQAEKKSESASGGKYPRRFPRFKMRLPVRLTGYGQSGSAWQEAAETNQVSRQGALVRMRQRVRHGTVLQLALPLPLKLRSHSFSETYYNAYAIVRSVLPRGDGVRDVGLEFLGKNPPEGYFDKPWDRFRTESWRGAERRRQPRFSIAEQVQLEFFTDNRSPVAHSFALTETLSRGGACVRVADLPDDFDLVGLACPRQNFESLAVVTNRYAGGDGHERLCLQFIEQQWPV